MNANELMLGNYVEFENQLHQIIGITDDEINLSRKSDSGKNHITYWVGIYSVKPIPLTEKWLLDFGFTKELDGFYRKNTSSMIEVLFSKSEVLVTNHSVCLSQIKSVNQIQNLWFSATGFHL